MSKNNSFRAPQKNLKSSWVELAFSKPKSAGPIVMKSLGNRSTAIIKDRGTFVTKSSFNNSNIY